MSAPKKIPLEVRGSIFNSLEKSYRQGEFCEEEVRTQAEKTRSVMKHFILNLDEILENCDNLDLSYLKYKKLKGISVSFKENSNFRIISQGHYAIENEGYLVSGNFMRCVGITLYNPENQISGLAHVAGENIRYLDNHLKEDSLTLSGFQEYMNSVIGDTDPAKIKVTLLSGYKAHIEYYKRFMEHFGLRKFKSIYNNKWASSQNHYSNQNYQCGSIVIEASTGRIYKARNNKHLSKVMGSTFNFGEHAMPLQPEF